MKNETTMSLSYKGKIILAPMVRVGTLPTRLLAVKYGADIVYSEEIIDFKILKTTRIVNDILGTVDFVLTDGTVVFRTCEAEKEKVVFQMGTADPERALKAAKVVEEDVAGIDVNMGCPKDYSVKGGMGAALLSQPDNVYNILTTLVKGVSKPVTCKIRILPTIEETVAFSKLVETTGIVALAVHGREKHERSRDPVHIDVIREVAKAVSIPVIANGVSSLVSRYEDIEKCRLETGCASVMLARAAQWNPSVFRKEGRLPASQVITDYLKLAVEFDNNSSNTKYCLQRLLHEDTTCAEMEQLKHATDMREICEIWNLSLYYEAAVKRRRAFIERVEKEDKTKTQANAQALINYTPKTESRKRKSSGSPSDVTEMKVKYHRKMYCASVTPKTVLFDWARRNGVLQPKYETMENKEDRLFRSTVLVADRRYSSSEWGFEVFSQTKYKVLRHVTTFGAVNSTIYSHLIDLLAFSRPPKRIAAKEPLNRPLLSFVYNALESTTDVPRQSPRDKELGSGPGVDPMQSHSTFSHHESAEEIEEACRGAARQTHQLKQKITEK